MNKSIVLVALSITSVALIVSALNFIQVSAVHRKILAGEIVDAEDLNLDIEIERLLSLIEVREEECTTLRESIAPVEVLQPELSSETIGNSVLGAWLDRVDDLAVYLSLKESLRIPELDHLTAADWLDVTKVEALETEADYRIALAKLRWAGKQNVGSKIRSALVAYLDSSGGKLPISPRDLIEFTDGTIGSNIIDRYRMSPSGIFPGLTIANSKFVMIEKEESVDGIWDSRIGFTDGGNVAGRPVVEFSKDLVLKAIESFESEHQRLPENSDELEPYVKKREYVEDLSGILEALTTKAMLSPPEGGG